MIPIPKPARAKSGQRIEDRTPQPQDEPPLTPEEARRQLGFPMLQPNDDTDRE